MPAPVDPTAPDFGGSESGDFEPLAQELLGWWGRLSWILGFLLVLPGLTWVLRGEASVDYSPVAVGSGLLQSTEPLLGGHLGAVAAIIKVGAMWGLWSVASSL